MLQTLEAAPDGAFITGVQHYEAKVDGWRPSRVEAKCKAARDKCDGLQTSFFSVGDSLVLRCPCTASVPRVLDGSRAQEQVIIIGLPT